MTPNFITVAIVFLCVCAPAARAETTVPSGPAPTLDGNVEDREWAGAQRLRLAPKGDVFLEQHGGDLHVGIRGPGPSIAGLALCTGDKVLILHTSASLGSAEYERRKGGWHRVRGFEWQCRESRGTPASEEARRKHFKTAGWSASTVNLGRPGETEFRIGTRLLGKKPLRLAVVSIGLSALGRGGGGAGYWPETVGAGARNRSLLMGSAPDTLDLDPTRWSTLDLTSQPMKAVLRPGTIREFACGADETQRYRCFVPSAYDARKTWPILYCLSLTARGDWYVEHLKAACEKQGWILVGSLSWRGGASAKSMKGLAALLEDTKARFNLHPTRQYVCGFGAGGRACFDIATRHPDRIAGVIAIGARPKRNTKISTSLAVGMICGKKDRAYPGVKRLNASLTKAGNPARTFTHAGGHVLPKDALLAEAVAWLEGLGKK